jgi:hypothetical protein
LGTVCRVTGVLPQTEVAVVDDDHRTLESLADLLEAAGYDVRVPPTVLGQLATPHPSEPGDSPVDGQRLTSHEARSL